jgi:hypothetical protein
VDLFDMAAVLIALAALMSDVNLGGARAGGLCAGGASDVNRALSHALLGALALAPLGCGGASGVEVTPAADLPEVPSSTLRRLDVDALLGTWYVVITNYDFWATRDNATISYARLPRSGAVELDDVVAYSQKSACGDGVERGDVVGVDVQDPTLHDEGRWAVTYFADSNFGTGAGMDVYARVPCLDRETEAEALRAIFVDPFLAERARGLFRVPHDACVNRE